MSSKTDLLPDMKVGEYGLKHPAQYFFSALTGFSRGFFNKQNE